jgi:hypothetical protein
MGSVFGYRFGLADSLYISQLASRMGKRPSGKLPPVSLVAGGALSPRIFEKI